MLSALDTKGYNKATAWCAPSAVAILTGTPLVRTTELLTRINGGTYRDLEGCWMEESILALHELGYRAQMIDIERRFPDTTHGPTLKRFWRERQGLEMVMPLLIQVSGHVLTTHMNFAADNWTERPVPLSDFPKQGRLVKSAYIVTKA